MSNNSNVGGVDRVVRLAAGVILLALALIPGLQIFGTGVLAWVVVIVGLVLLATGALRLCPLYSVLGINTGPRGEG
jgi:hypothetical protein